jgi:hypothetical protein
VIPAVPELRLRADTGGERGSGKRFQELLPAFEHFDGVERDHYSRLLSQPACAAVPDDPHQRRRTQSVNYLAHQARFLARHHDLLVRALRAEVGVRSTVLTINAHEFLVRVVAGCSSLPGSPFRFLESRIQFVSMSHVLHLVS